MVKKRRETRWKMTIRLLELNFCHQVQRPGTQSRQWSARWFGCHRIKSCGFLAPRKQWSANASLLPDADWKRKRILLPLPNGRRHHVILRQLRAHRSTKYSLVSLALCGASAAPWRRLVNNKTHCFSQPEINKTWTSSRASKRVKSLTVMCFVFTIVYVREFRATSTHCFPDNVHTFMKARAVLKKYDRSYKHNLNNTLIILWSKLLFLNTKNCFQNIWNDVFL